MVCGETLEYHGTTRDVVCSYCGRRKSGHITCPAGHFICNTCHNHDALLVIEEVIMTSRECDPIHIAELAMSFPGLPMLGCQHAYIAGGALMAALKNNGSKNIADQDIREVFSRTRKQAHGGYCGLTGVCGITPALGACASILTGSRCGRDEEQRLTMELTSRVSRVITDLTGPSCCKSYVLAGLEAAVQFLQENLDIDLQATPAAVCRYVDKHPHGCRLEKCSYYEKSSYVPVPGI